MHEGDAGARTAVFNVSLSKPSSAWVSVSYASASANASANKPGDYTGKTGTLTFAPGTTSSSVKVVVNADTSFEGDENFNVTLSGASGATITDATGVGTIVDDD